MGSAPTIPRPDFQSTRAALAILHRGTRRGRETRAPRWLRMAGVAAFAPVGLLLQPSKIGATQAGNVTHWGGWPLETAFTAMVIVAALLGYAWVDILFRTHGARAFQHHPVHGGALALDRFAVASAVSAPWVLAVGLLTLPGALRAGWTSFGVVATFIVLSWFLSLAIPPATLLLADTQRPQTSVPRSGAFIALPGVAFAVVAFMALFLKLGLEEPLRVAFETGIPAWTRAASVATFIPCAGAAICALHWLRAFPQRRARMENAFNDAERFTPSGVYEHERELMSRRGWDCRGLGERERIVFRIIRVQCRRSAPFAKIGTFGVAILLAFVLWAADGRIHPTLVFALVGAWIVVVARPARRSLAVAGLHADSLLAALSPMSMRHALARRAAVAESVALSWALVPLLIAALLVSTTHIASIVGAALVPLACVAHAIFATRTLSTSEP